MAIDLNQPATLGHLQRVTENMKVYVDTDKTKSFKGHLEKDNTHYFYNTATPTEETEPLFEIKSGGGEESLIVDFRYKHISNDEGYEAYNFTHTNAEIIDAINNGRTVIIKGLINTARDYAPHIFQLHTYMKNSGRYEFVYSTFSNYMEITEYKLVVYNNDNLEFLVNTYKVNQTIPEIPYGDEGQFISFDEEGYLIAVDAPTGGAEPFLVTFYFSSTNMSILQNANKTYAEISAALDEGKVVILKGIDTARDSQQFYYFNVSKYDKSASQIIFTRVYHTYGAKPEIWYYLLGAGHMIGKFTIDLSQYPTTSELTEALGEKLGKDETLPLTNGGTGATNAKDAANNLITALEIGDTAPTEEANLVVQGNGDYSDKYYLKPISMLWSLIKDKISSVLGLTETSYSGNAATATKLASQAGILVNLGSFTTGYLDGTAPVEPGIQGTLPIDAGGTGATNVTTARNNLNVPPTNHASAATTYGKGGPTSYGHLKVSDDYEASPSTGVNASNAVAASLYVAQRLNGRLIDLESKVAGYSLVGTVTFGITMESNSVSTACTVKDEGGTLPFTKGGGGTNTTAYFKPSQNITYSCKFKRKHAYYKPQLRCNTSIPTATSVTPTGTICLTDAAMALPTGELADVEYEDVTFSTSNYYYAYHSGGSGSGVSYVDRGGVLYCYSKG